LLPIPGTDSKTISWGDALEMISTLSDEGKALTAEQLDALMALYKSPPVTEAIAANSKDPKVWLPDHVEFYLNNSVKFSQPNFSPSPTDILKTRTLTVGMKTVGFEDQVDGAYIMGYMPQVAQMLGGEELPGMATLKWSVTDVGGQRSERQKWASCFSDAQCLVYLCGLNEYKQVLYEDNKQRRIDESIGLFEVMVNNQYLMKIPVLLVFTKKDLFKSSFDAEVFKAAMPEYEPVDGEAPEETAMKHLEKTFLSKIKKTVRGQQRPPTATCFASFVDNTNPDDFSELIHQLKQIVAKHNSARIMNIVQTQKETGSETNRSSVGDSGGEKKKRGFFGFGKKK